MGESVFPRQRCGTLSDFEPTETVDGWSSHPIYPAFVLTETAHGAI